MINNISQAKAVASSFGTDIDPHFASARSLFPALFNANLAKSAK